ncbi:hypothetical protein DY000_02009314 [Brassica cretica]|uniref:Uncharacterized protein n=1 Tax=Brassica cretica TaxID=69181 RepID=A0ABQ7CGA8_BRACR|nr:hypothetical protein DY000_02009314 [Brassica cretica]
MGGFKRWRWPGKENAGDGGSKNEELRSRRTENGCKNGEADEQDFWTEKTMLSRKRRASKGEAKEMAQTEEGAVNGGKGRSLLVVLMF